MFLVYPLRNLIYILLFGLIFFPMVLIAQKKYERGSEIIGLIDKIDHQAISIPFYNSLQINNKGGHIQGIQYVKYNEKEYYFLSGSSNSYSYYSVVEIGDNNSVISVNKILDNPYKHAGGFQIYKSIMAIGIEDNTKKDKSKVFIYKIDHPENLPAKPLKIINRSGKVERATAGCVGVVEIAGHLLVVVGDWDTKHLDFYKIEKEKLFDDQAVFKLEYTIDTEKIDKTGWIDNSWLSYQNLNFIKDRSDNIYLAGMTTNNHDENVLDIFWVDTKDFTNFKLKKIHTQIFEKNSKANFRWGAGVFLSDDHKIKILSSGAHLQKKSILTIFE